MTLEDDDHGISDLQTDDENMQIECDCQCYAQCSMCRQMCFRASTMCATEFSAQFPNGASNGARGGASNGARGGASNGARGGASNGARGGASNGARGGASNGARGGASNGARGGASNGVTGGIGELAMALEDDDDDHDEYEDVAVAASRTTSWFQDIAGRKTKKEAQCVATASQHSYWGHPLMDSIVDKPDSKHANFKGACAARSAAASMCDCGSVSGWQSDEAATQLYSPRAAAAARGITILAWPELEKAYKCEDAFDGHVTDQLNKYTPPPSATHKTTTTRSQCPRLHNQGQSWLKYSFDCAFKDSQTNKEVTTPVSVYLAPGAVWPKPKDGKQCDSCSAALKSTPTEEERKSLNLSRDGASNGARGGASNGARGGASNGARGGASNGARGGASTGVAGGVGDLQLAMALEDEDDDANNNGPLFIYE